MSQYVEVADLTAWYGAPLPSEEQAERFLDAAEDEVRAEFRAARRDLDADIVAGRMSTVALERVVCELVCAVLRNPTGARSGTSTRTEGPFSQSESFTLAEHARGELGLTDRHRRLLGLASGGAFTIHPTGSRPRPGWDTERGVR